MTHWADLELERRQAEIARLQADLQLTRGAMAADDERLRTAAAKAGVTDFGCDTADHMADRILELTAVLDAARERCLGMMKDSGRHGDYIDGKVDAASAIFRALDGEVKP